MHGPVWVPSDAAEGMAKVTLSFPDWKDGGVLPVTITIPVVDPMPALKK